MSRPRHVHACVECGRGFYLCSERDCDLAPDTCRACEMDRLDAYFSQPALPLTRIPQEPQSHEHQQSIPLDLPQSV